MPQKWLQERPNGSKNDPGMPPRRASRGKTVQARIWPWLSGETSYILSSCSLFARRRTVPGQPEARCRSSPAPSNDYGTDTIDKARFRPWLSCQIWFNLSSCSLFPRKQAVPGQSKAGCRRSPAPLRSHPPPTQLPCFRMLDFGFRVSGLGSEVWDLGLGVGCWGSGFRV